MLHFNPIMILPSIILQGDLIDLYGRKTLIVKKACRVCVKWNELLLLCKKFHNRDERKEHVVAL